MTSLLAGTPFIKIMISTINCNDSSLKNNFTNKSIARYLEHCESPTIEDLHKAIQVALEEQEYLNRPLFTIKNIET